MKIVQDEKCMIVEYYSMPKDYDLEERINNSSTLRERIFPLRFYEKKVEGYAAAIESNNSYLDTKIVDIGVMDGPDGFYQNNGKEHMGKRQLRLAITSDSEKEVQSLLSEIQELFPEKEEIKLSTIGEKSIEEHAKQSMKSWTELGFFHRYDLIKAFLKDTKELPHQKIEGGVVPYYLTQMMGIAAAIIGQAPQAFPLLSDIQLVNRIKGKYKEKDVELSLVHVSGIVPATYYGVLLSKRHETKCPMAEKEGCDLSDTFAAYLLNNNAIIVGGMQLTPDSLPYCYPFMAMTSPDMPMNYVNNIISELQFMSPTSSGKISDERITDMKILAKLLHDVSGVLSGKMGKIIN